MFRKLISNLSFSPSLVAELAVFAKNLKKQKRLRFIGVALLVLALLLQVFGIVFLNNKTQTHESNLIYGGVINKEYFLQRYKQNDLSIRGILSSIGVGSDDITNLKNEPLTNHSEPYKYRIARTPMPNSTQQPLVLLGSEANLYASNIDTSLPIEPSLSGYSHTVGKFTILINSGDILVEHLPSSFKSITPKGIDVNTTTINETTGESNPTTVRPGDLITYTIDVKNTSTNLVDFSTPTYIGDILEYADLVNVNSGVIDDKKTTISWIHRNIEPNKNTQYTFSVRIKSQIPTTAQNRSVPYSYDCVIDTTLPGSPQINLLCPATKNIELMLHKLPKLSQLTIVLMTTIILLLSTLLYIKNVQYYEEIRLIRHGINKGTLL